MSADLRSDLVSRQITYENTQFDLEDEKEKIEGFIEKSTSEATTAFYTGENEVVDAKIKNIIDILDQAYDAGAPILTLQRANYDADSLVALRITARKTLGIFDRAFYILPIAGEETGTFDIDTINRISDNIYEFGIIEDKEYMEKLIDQGKKIHFYSNDPATEYYSEFENCIYDPERSIAKIAYDELIVGTTCDDELTKLFVNCMQAYHAKDETSEYFENGENLTLLNKALIRKNGNDGARTFINRITEMWNDKTISFTDEEKELIEEEKQINDAKTKSVAKYVYARF